ncbi:MAG: MFS transporter [Terriglobia bacterium]
MKTENLSFSSRAVVVVLLMATTINYIDRQTLSVLAPLLQKQLHISTLEYSYAVNSFLVVYAIMYLLMGRVVDWLGTRKGMGFAVIGWSLIEILHVTVIGIKTLCVYRALLAVGEAAIVPGAVKGVAEYFDARERSVAVGTFEMGFSLGPLIAPPLVGWITLREGWHAAFLWTGILGLIWCVPWFLFYRTPERIQPGSGRSAGAKTRTMPWAVLFRSREAWAIGLGRFFSDPVWFFYLFWIPKYLADTHGLNLKAIAAVAWIPYVASLAGSLSGGSCSAWLMKRGTSILKSRESAMLFSAILVSAGVLCIYLRSLFWVLVVMSSATFGLQFWGANLDTLTIDLFPPEYAGQAMGFAGLMAASGGILFTAGTGYLVEHYSYAPVFLASAITLPIGLVLLFLLLRRSSPIEQRQKFH